jgi:hypothetical protein
MLIAIDPVEHSVCGLAGGIHKDYRSKVVGKQELAGGWRRIYLQLIDDMTKPPGANRKPTQTCTVIAPSALQYHNAYRREIWNRLEHGDTLVDVTVQ